MPQTLLRVAERPWLFVVPDFATAAACEELEALALDEVRLRRAGVELRRDDTGTSAELPRALHPGLAALAAAAPALLGLHNRVDATVRMRSYGEGQGHPPHVDTYEIGGAQLLATAILCVAAPDLGGETLFLDGAEGPLQVEHRVGQLVAWHDLDGEGRPEAASRHFGAAVLRGRKIILSIFIYGDPGELLRAPRGERAPPAVRARVRSVVPARRAGAALHFGRVLAIVDDGVPRETVDYLRRAAHERGVRVATVHPARFDFAADRVLRDGDLLYCPAVSTHAMHVEQHLWQPRVASFHLDDGGPLFANTNAIQTFERAGLPVPRTFRVQSNDRALLRKMVDALGGLPVVFKVPGYSRGVGVVRADSLPSLFGLIDFALATNARPVLTAYVPEAVHYRLVVVGDRVVACYRNLQDTDDFRSSGSADPADYRLPTPEGAEAIAVAACRSLRIAHGGVDILAHPSGRLYLLEANFPCYYAQAQTYGGVDVAGAMMDYLLGRAATLAPVPDGPAPVLVEIEG